MREPKSVCGVLLFCAVVVAAHAQTVTVLANFTAASGSSPYTNGPSLVQGADGNFYGVARVGGANQGGTVFKLTSGGTLTALYSFCVQPKCADGVFPRSLTLGSDGNFYGTSGNGGAGGTQGTIFKITPTGTLTTLHIFNITDGQGPSGLVQAADGNFYGTTRLGGTFHGGTFFKITPGGALTTLYNFGEFKTEGTSVSAPLVQGKDGNFYGTASEGGAQSLGTVFKITPEGTLTTLHTFGSTPSDGWYPYGGLILATDGNFYGTTSAANGVLAGGTVFKIDSLGTLTTLHNFPFQASANDGSGPVASLLEASDGNFYGTTSNGGPSNQGTIFEITPSGVFTLLYSFSSPGFSSPDGKSPDGGLIQGTDGNLYGTTSAGGSGLGGTIFRYQLMTIPPPAKVTAVVNGASFVAGGIVPGEIATAFGTNLTSGSGINITSGLPLPTAFLNDTLMVNNQPVALFAVDNVNGQQQINFQVPWEVSSGPMASVAVENNGSTGPSVSLPVLVAQPGIFNYSVGGNIFGAILHASFQLADTAHPTKPGETVLIYCTGLGAVSSPPADGEAGTGQPTMTMPTVTIGGAQAIVTFSGLAPGFVGLYQINAGLPAGLTSGNQPVLVTLAGTSSNSVLLPVQ